LGPSNQIRIVRIRILPLDKIRKTGIILDMNMEIDFNSLELMFEITRFCNMSCPHCVRGESQRKRIKKEYIDSALQNVKYISTLSVTGGEPALAVDLIDYIREACNHYGVEFGDFWMATNGTVTTPKFFRAIERMYTDASQHDISGFRVSVDDYHDSINIWPFRNFFENLEYTLDSKIYLEEKGAPEAEYLIGDGRAAENYYTTREVKHGLHLMQDGVLEGTIYVNANGYIISTCDISYNRMDNDKDFTIGHVTDNWQEMFSKFFETHPDLIYK
jgi:hypothetical protein